MDAEGVSLVMGSDRFLTAPDDADAPLQLPCGECEEVLHREILASAEGAADGRVTDDDLLFGQPQHLGDLLAVLVQPLPGGLDDNPPRLVDVGDAGFGLQERVLLPGGRELPLEHDVRGFETRLDVALADRDARQHVRSTRLVHERRV